MIRSLEVSPAFRGLASKPFSSTAECVLGRFTLVFGRNGSGKTTFSELLRIGADPEQNEGTTTTLNLRIEGRNSSLVLNAAELPVEFYVYNRYYVLDSLNLFLDGKGGSPPILKLGVANVEAQSEIDRLSKRIAQDQTRKASLEELRRARSGRVSELERLVKELVVGALGQTDPLNYNTQRYTIAKARQAMSSPKLLDDAAFDQALSRATGDRFERIELTPVPDRNVALTSSLNELLRSTIQVESIDRLARDPELASWIEAGAALHSPGDLCAFCQSGSLSGQLLDSYSRHFNDEMVKLRERLQKAVTYFEALSLAWENWRLVLAPSGVALPENRVEIEAEVVALSAGIVELRTQIDDAVALARKRLADPLNPVTDRATLTYPDLAPLDSLLGKNNNDCDGQEAAARAARAAVESHFGAMHAEEYATLKSDDPRLSRLIGAVQVQLDREHDRLRAAEQSLDDTGIMAGLIDEDLRLHFGHSHLSITVSEDRKGYVVLRGDRAARRLSEGERNAIALSYFLRSLEAQRVHAERGVVVIDDPVTSLDRESQFAAFALADERTKNFAQRIFLTHDYEYFRLLLNQKRSALNRSRALLKEGDQNEKAFPRVAVLEMVAMTGAARSRSSALRPMSEKLLLHSSEYHYLFENVAQAVLGEREAELPLLGNAARRLIEGFISFRAPHGNTFQEKIDSISQTGVPPRELAARVTKFMHGQSHRDEPRLSASLDIPSIENELSAVLSFMRTADGQHFRHMCDAVGVPFEGLLALLDQ